MLIVKVISLGYSNMNITYLKENKYHISLWSSGQTTEIVLSPENGQYLLDEFDYRISSATIETETSTFTSLPGYKRLLMLLAGKVKLEQENNEVRLDPFQVFAFNGSVLTKSFGQCIDFNLIYRDSMKGLMKPLVTNETYLLPKAESLLYCIEDCKIVINNIEYFVSKSDSLRLTEVKRPVELSILGEEKRVSLVYASCSL